ncbi:hypothetical protein DPMN_017525 [Dreissena polymorpha]|uniref:Uncharacterized protein n=1 Tax=Dreissena polymorpha TaxID=45954 RepID=A0A9D4NF01_DREPO|nr:hypothetical protein DPMN_017525 [Dreissena polymorpha]
MRLSISEYYVSPMCLTVSPHDSHEFVAQASDGIYTGESPTMKRNIKLKKQFHLVTFSPEPLAQ